MILTSPKKCYIIGSPGGPGAIAGHFTAVGRELAARGNSVVILCSSVDSSPQSPSANPSFILWPSPRPTRLTDAIFLLRLIARTRPDCLIANFAAVNWMCVVGWLRRVKHRIAFYHTLTSQIERDFGQVNRSVRGLRRQRKRIAYQAASAIAGVSRAALRDAQFAWGVPESKCFFWQYSMPDPVGRLPLRTVDEREDLVVCVGRLNPSKGQEVLIQAMASEHPALRSARVEFLGTGPMLEHLRRLADHAGVGARCHFAGLVSHEHVLDRLSRARVSVVPSQNEAFGLVNIESMAVGTPVVASSVGGICEIIRDGIDGCLVAPNNPEALAEKLSLTLQEKPFRVRLGQNARQHFLETYEESRQLKGQVDRLEELVRSTASPQRNGS